MMAPRRRLLAAGVCAVALASPSGASPPLRGAGSRTVTFRTADDVSIAATVYEPSRRPGGGIVLVHMLRRTRADWDALQQTLADEGFVALALDLRGHGASGGRAPDASGTADHSVFTADVAAAVRHLQALGISRLGVIGASLGANVAAAVAASEPAVRSLALLSPGLDYRGVKVEAALRKCADRRVLLVGSAEDPYAVRSVRQLAGAGGNRELLILQGAGHGTAMLSRAPDLGRTLVDWFVRTLL